MQHSDIFNEFVKIAKEKGLIDGDKDHKDLGHAEHTEKDFHETNPRMDSLSIEQISKLYNNKPQMPKGMEYKESIMELAHPEPQVLCPAYDRLNGLVENEMEGQAIRARITMKTPDGQLSQRKYAEQQLVLSLVRTANELDNLGNEGLRKLADICLLQASGKQFVKQAQWQIAVGIAAAVAALYVQQHKAFYSDGWSADYQKALAEINDMLNSNSDFGVGYSYTPEFLQLLAQLQSKLAELNDAVSKVMPTIANLEKPRTGPELKELAGQPVISDVKSGMTDLKTIFENDVSFINQVISNFSNNAFKQRAIASKGFLTSLVDDTDILHGGGALISDDFDDVKRSLLTLKSDIASLAQDIQTYTTVHDKALAQMQEAQTETTKDFAPPAPATDAGTPDATGHVPGTFEKLENEAKDLF